MSDELPEDPGPARWPVHPFAIVREYFPDATDKAAEEILWNRTGWPCFWKGEPEPSLRAQLAQLAEAEQLGLTVCSCCGKTRLRSQLNSLGFCRHGDWVLRRADNG